MSTLDDLRKKYEEITSKGKGGNSDFIKNFINVEMGGEALIRILPNPSDEIPFYKEFSTHHWNGRNYACLRDKDQKCPVCEVYFALWKTGLDENIALARQLKARKKFWMNVVERSSDQVKILSSGIKLFENILATILDEEYGPVYDLTEGFDYKIKKVKQGDWPDYSQSCPSRHQGPAGTDQDIDRYMGSLHDIHSMIKYPEYEEMERVAAEVLSKSSGISTMDETPTSTEDSSVDLTKLLHD